MEPSGGVDFWIVFWALEGLDGTKVEAVMAEYFGLTVLTVGAVEGLEDAKLVGKVEEVVGGVRGFVLLAGAEADVLPLLVRRWVSLSGHWEVSDGGGGDFPVGWDEDGPSASLSLEKPAPKLR